jgi:hypothetical protein
MVPQGLGPRYRSEWTFAAFEVLFLVSMLGVIGVIDLGPFLPSVFAATVALLVVTIRRQRRTSGKRPRA